MTVRWFRRFGDIPGVEYTPPEPVDRTKLKGHDAVARVERYEFDGRINESLRWPADDDDEFGSSASPAHTVAFERLDDTLATTTLLRRLWEGLELPGEASDYHFAVQGLAETLYKRRAREPEVLAWVEYLCWLDIRLLQACPEAVTNEHADGYEDRRRFYSVPTFSRLVDLYTREGFLQDAMGVAHLAERFEQGVPVEELQERMAALRAEDGN